MAQLGSAVPNDDGPTCEAPAVGCQASSDALLLSLCLQDQVPLFTVAAAERPFGLTDATLTL